MLKWPNQLQTDPMQAQNSSKMSWDDGLKGTKMKLMQWLTNGYNDATLKHIERVTNMRIWPRNKL